MLDLVRWMAVETGFKPVFLDMTFQQAQEAVLSDKADILTSLFYSDKRKERFEFTEIIFDVPASIFVRVERTDIKDIDGLNGKTIAIQRGITPGNSWNPKRYALPCRKRRILVKRPIWSDRQGRCSHR